MKKITVIGGSVVDILARPVGRNIFETGSVPAEEIRMSCGGDARNEAVILSRLGENTEIITKIGTDDAGERILVDLQEAGVGTGHCIRSEQYLTSVNLVLIDEQAQRHFVTTPYSSQRHLNKEDILQHLQDAGEIVSLASIFVSFDLTLADYAEIFRMLKQSGRIVCADLTRKKHQETLDEFAAICPYIDYLFPNEEEVALLSGIDDAEENARKLVQAGVKHAVIKTGRNGCILCSKDELLHIPAYPAEHCIDTTGAGDTFAAAFIHALSQGMSFAECGMYANAAASLTIEHTGAAEGLQKTADVRERFQIIKEKYATM